MKDGVENYCRFNGMKTPRTKARTKVLASFEAGMDSPNLPWHVNISSLGKFLAFAKLNNSTVKWKHFFGSLLYFPKIFRESCVEKYKEFNGVKSKDECSSELKFESWHELAIAMNLVIML